MDIKEVSIFTKYLYIFELCLYSNLFTVVCSIYQYIYEIYHFRTILCFFIKAISFYIFYIYNRKYKISI